ncbi:MAG: hypothetical protein FD180_4840 [Planctomycetota bacterium]|nr:MAG: hypothetical protein FD180_4840 [Planctomycetota bacterium]
MTQNAEPAYFRHAVLRDAAYPSTRKAKRLRRFAFASSGQSQS